MGKWVLVVKTNCADRLRENEFNEWYDNVHIPDLLKVPGFLCAARYVNPDLSAWEAGKYLAIYDIETDDIHGVEAAMASSFPRWAEQGRLSDLLILVSMAFCQQMSTRTR